MTTTEFLLAFVIGVASRVQHQKFETQKKAIDLCPEEVKEDLAARLKLYENN